MKTITRHGATISSVLIFLLPAVASAQVKITEIMYDTPGADSGHEWVEVANLGAQPVDMGKYKFFEDGTNHSLTLTKGSSVLMPGAAAIIADDAKKFAADYPAFSGTLFDSTFSLSNTGETLSLKDASSSVLDVAAYSAATLANGTGGTLNLQNNSFVAAMASPGIYPGPMSPVPAPAAKAPAAKKTAKASASSKTSAAKGSTASAYPGNSSSSFSNQNNLAAAAPALPNIPPMVLWIGGLAVLVLAGIAGIFFVLMKGSETSLSGSEFTIE